jgi:hypothetical protein
MTKSNGPVVLMTTAPTVHGAATSLAMPALWRWKVSLMACPASCITATTLAFISPSAAGAMFMFRTPPWPTVAT